MKLWAKEERLIIREGVRWDWPVEERRGRREVVKRKWPRWFTWN